MEYIIEITETETGDKFYTGKFDYGQAIVHCHDGQEETGDEYSHKVYTVH